MLTRKPTLSTDVDLLLQNLPKILTDQIQRPENLIEIIIDLGRLIELRYLDGTTKELSIEGTPSMISLIMGKLSEPGEDNRCGLDHTLHRISVLRNKALEPVGLTIRIGRPFVGNASLIADLLLAGKSVLVVGSPGKGKTSILREAAKILSVDMGKRVVIVDTSNEIAGEGDIPHRAVGKSRRIQVPKSKDQHEVMVEAVENHNPQVVVIDEVSTIEESYAAQTISQRGVQILATAHGNTLFDIIRNKQLSEMVGGVDKVTLSDDTAARRGTQKTVQERIGDPPFDCVVEIHAFDEVAVHLSTADAVDALLADRQVQPELRRVIDGVVRVLIPGRIEPEKTPTYEPEMVEYRTKKQEVREYKQETRSTMKPRRRR
jgi:stage III sporulation protein SpoIIIAA